jgi:hypothetical protein
VFELCNSNLPATLLRGDLSDGLHLQPSLIIVSAILGPASPRLDQVEESKIPYLIYSPCSRSRTWIAVDFDNNFWVYREYYTQRVTADVFAKQVLEREQGEYIRYGILDSSTWSRCRC